MPPTSRGGRGPLTHLQQLARDVEQLLQLPGALQLRLLALGVLVLMEQRQQRLGCGVQLELLLGCAVCNGRGSSEWAPGFATKCCRSDPWRQRQTQDQHQNARASLAAQSHGSGGGRWVVSLGSGTLSSAEPWQRQRIHWKRTLCSLE